MLMFSRRYIEFLEKENAELKKQVQALTNTVFSVQGAPPPFVETPPEEAVHISRKRTDQWLAELAAAETRD